MNERQPNIPGEQTPDTNEREAGVAKVTDLVNNGQDINSAAIHVQQMYGVDVGPDWWQEHVTDKVGDGATPEAMATAFDKAFPEFLETRDY